MNTSFSDNFFNNFFSAPLFPFGMMMPPLMYSYNDDFYAQSMSETVCICLLRMNVRSVLSDPAADPE